MVVPQPSWTQNDAELLVLSLLLYPVLLGLTAVPAFHPIVNLVAGFATLVYVGALLPRPSLALPVFGTWSVGVPAGLLLLEVPLASLVAIVSLAGAWVPLLFAMAVAAALLR